MIDSHGLVRDGRHDLAEDQRAFATEWQRVNGLDLDDASCCDPVAIAHSFRPTVLIGTTGSAGAFSEGLIREVARHDPEPVIMPLSNPSDRVEALPEDILRWTDDRALVATGSPFRPVDTLRGRRLIGQANNVFIFPGFGLGAIVGDARELTDDAFRVAAHALSELTSDERLASGALYPPISALRSVSRTVAVALVRHLRDSGAGRWLEDDAIEPAIDRAMWSPAYLPYEPA